MGMKVIVAGGRDFKGTSDHSKWLINVLLNVLDADTIICGMARGADQFGYEIASFLGISILEYPANWDLHGKKAGYLRNTKMAEIADAVVLFPGGKGTQHMYNIAKVRGLRVIEYKEG